MHRNTKRRSSLAPKKMGQSQMGLHRTSVRSHFNDDAKRRSSYFDASFDYDEYYLLEFD